MSVAVSTDHCRSLAITTLIFATRKSLYLCMYIAIHRPSIYSACANVNFDVCAFGNDRQNKRHYTRRG